MVKKLHRYILTAFISLITVSGVWLWKTASLRTELPEQSRPAVTVVENHSAALSHWIDLGFKNTDVLHIDTHDDFRKIDERKITTLGQYLAQDDLGKIREADSSRPDGLYNIGNFLYAAARMGIVKSIYWIAPFNFLDNEKSLPEFQQYLQDASFATEDIKTFHPDRGCFSGKARGLSLTVCSPNHLPALNEPILLSVDADFFPYAAGVKHVALLPMLVNTVSAIQLQKYQVRDIIVSESFDGGFVLAQQGWVIDVLTELLNNPEFPHKDLPELWRLWQTAETNRLAGRFRLTRNNLSQKADTLRNNPSIMIYRAEAEMQLNNDRESLRLLEQSCGQGKRYCYGFPELGLQLLEMDSLPRAEPYFDATENVDFFMDYSELGYAIALLRSGAYEKSLHVLEHLRIHYGPFPIDYLVGHIALLRQDEESAIKAFDTAGDELMRLSEVSISFPEISAAIDAAIMLYKKHGRNAAAERLLKTPLFHN